MEWKSKAMVVQYLHLLKLSTPTWDWAWPCDTHSTPTVYSTILTAAFSSWYKFWIWHRNLLGPNQALLQLLGASAFTDALRIMKVCIKLLDSGHRHLLIHVLNPYWVSPLLWGCSSTMLLKSSRGHRHSWISTDQQWNHIHHKIRLSSKSRSSNTLQVEGSLHKKTVLWTSSTLV